MNDSSSACLVMRGLCVAAVLVFCAVRADAAEWLRTQWRGEKAWSSVSAHGWTAVVSEERSRLIALLPPAGKPNLLFAEQKDEFSWGGHRFWLGPQTSWSAPWPPCVDWETSAAERVEADGALLRVVHPRTNSYYPRLTRTYAWERDSLHCAVAWSDPRFQGIHIMQMPPRTVVSVKRRVSSKLPLGYVLLPIYKRPGLWTDREASSAVATLDGDSVTLRNANVTEKIGVPPQPIVARVDGYRITLRRGRQSGMSDVAPDMGMLTQVFVGSAESVFTEIEQLSPLGGEGESVSEILLEPETIRPRAARTMKNPVRRR